MRTAARHAILAALLALAGLLAPAAGAEGELRLTEAGNTRFPDRSYVLTLPAGMSLDESRVDVLENGELVDALSVVPVGEAAEGEFGVVLVIDASNSMRGAAITGAVEAARAFVEQSDPNQLVAILTFNRAPSVLLPFTADQEEIEAALAGPPGLAGKTHVYDAVSAALDLLRDAEIAAGSVVVLSDGSDTGSAISRTEVANRARAAGVRVFSVGLRSKGFDFAALEQLAADAGGTYSEAASSDDLARVFEDLGARLASEYLVRYRSASKPDSDVHVAVRVSGLDGVATSVYTSPPLDATPNPPYHHSLAERFWRSPAGMLAVAAACALLTGLVLAALLRPRRRTLRRRMAEFVSLPVPTQKADENAGRTELVLAQAEKSFERTRWWSRFKEELELGKVTIAPIQIVAWTVIGAALAAWLLFALLGTPLVVPLALGVPLVVRSQVKRRVERQRRLFADQLPDNLQVLASALRAGHSLVGALSVVVEDCPEPSREEFRRVIADEQLGVSLEEAFGVVAQRMSNRDLDQVALVAALQQETGGNTAEVLDRVSDTIRERFELRRLVKTLTTQGRMSRWVVSFLPVGLLVLITAINPAYMAPLYTHPLGRVLLLVAGLMVVAGSLVIKRIVDIKV
ncbi:MAG: type II secretion system F family protein [Gaiellaceae bacterium]